MKKNSWRSTKMARIEENQETFLKIYKQLGENFKARREQKGWTQQKQCGAVKNLFPDIHITQSDVSEYEYGCELEMMPVHMRSYKVLCLAFALDMHPSEIYSIKGKKEAFSPKLRKRLRSEEVYKKNFGRNLDCIMRKERLSNRLLADRLYTKAEEMGLLKSPDASISAKTIQRYRKGERNPPFGYLILLCNVLNVEIVKFLS